MTLDDDLNSLSFNGFDQSGISAKLNWELNSNLDLTWLTFFGTFDSYSEQSEFVGLLIYTEAPEVAEGHPTIIDIDTVTSELRLTGETGCLSWMDGAYLSDEEILSQQGLGLGADYTANADGIRAEFQLHGMEHQRMVQGNQLRALFGRLNSDYSGHTQYITLLMNTLCY